MSGYFWWLGFSSIFILNYINGDFEAMRLRIKGFWISLRNWELPKWEPENWARNTENFKNWENIFTEYFLADDSKSSKTQNLQIWEILKLRIHKLGFTRLWELWITLHSNCEKNKTEKPKTTILSHQECKLWDQNFKWETIFEQLYKDSKWQFTF